MNEFIGTSPWVAITKDVARKRRGPVVAAISYVGAKASEVLPLRKGDFLICDASQRAIKQGVTSAKTLAAYLRKGVQIFSHEGLHSKVVATENFAWVGSANASGNSRDNLTEASVRIEGPVGRSSFKWALSLATEDAKLSLEAKHFATDECVDLSEHCELEASKSSIVRNAIIEHKSLLNELCEGRGSCNRSTLDMVFK